MPGLLNILENIRYRPTAASTGLLNAAAYLLANSGPSKEPQGFGNALGSGLLGFTQGYSDFEEQEALAEDRRALADYRKSQAAIEAAKVERQRKLDEALSGIDLSDPGAANALVQSGNLSEGLDLYKAQNPNASAEENVFLSSPEGYVTAGKRSGTGKYLEVDGKRVIPTPADIDLAKGKAAGSQGERIVDVKLSDGTVVPMRAEDAVNLVRRQYDIPSTGGHSRQPDDYEPPASSSEPSGALPPVSIGQSTEAEAQAKAQPQKEAVEKLKAEGRSRLETVLKAMEGSYNELNKLGALPDETKSAAYNFSAKIRAGQLGQKLGGFQGSKEQRYRDEVLKALPLLVQSVKASLGITASEFNTPKEVERFMAAVTDPLTDVNVIRRQFKLLRDFFINPGNANGESVEDPEEAADRAEYERRYNVKP